MTFIAQALEMFGTPETSFRHLKRSKHPLEATYAGMLRRCYNKNEKLYLRYGGRGIKVCERWRLPYGRGFANFVADMGAKPLGTSLDRMRNDGDYEPENCRWTDRTTQNRNREWSRHIMVNGVKTHVAEIAKHSERPLQTVAARLKRGWTVEEAISNKTYQGLRRKEQRGK